VVVIFPEVKKMRMHELHYDMNYVVNVV